MKQEEKELLLKDLCSRLLYDVEAQVFNSIEGESKPFVVNKPVTFDDIDAFVKNDVVIDIKPYLRPLTSITEEEKLDLEWYYRNSPFDSKDIGHCVDYFNKNHLDYRGLIPMGLAIEAPKDMYSKQ